MRGKKIDTDFITQFILECAAGNKISSDEIISSAKNQINEIDIKIKEVEFLKILRSKLLDVIISFEKTEKKVSADKERLQFYQIENQQICKFICDQIKDGIKFSNIKYSPYKESDVMFCIKRLCEFKVLLRKNNLLLCGEEYINYMKFVMKED